MALAIFVLLSFLTAIPIITPQRLPKYDYLKEIFGIPQSGGFVRSSGTNPGQLSYGSSCIRPRSLPYCVSLFKCRELSEMVNKGPSPKEKETLLNHFCGRLHGIPYVCCNNYLKGQVTHNTSNASLLKFEKCGSRPNIFHRKNNIDEIVDYGRAADPGNQRLHEN